jgi:flagellar motor component MotA
MEAGFHGVMAIRAGEHPRIIEQKLDTFLPLEERGVVLAA